MKKLHKLKETYRGVKLIEDSRITLAEWLERWIEEYKKPPVLFYDPFKPDRPIRPELAYARLRKILKQADLEQMRFHDIRHNFASVAANIGIVPQVLSSIVGHTKASFTLDTYAHVTTDMQKSVSGIVEKFMTDMFGKELKLCLNGENPEKAQSVNERTAAGKAES